jgi:hypothetical protein
LRSCSGTFPTRLKKLSFRKGSDFGAFFRSTAKQAGDKPLRRPSGLAAKDDGLLGADAGEWFSQQGWSVLETTIGAGALEMIRELDRFILSKRISTSQTKLPDGMSRTPAGCRIRTLRSFMRQEGRRIMTASCLGVFFYPSQYRRMI